MSFHVLSAIIRATMADLVGTRFRSADLPLMGLLGTLYSLANAAVLQLLRTWFGLADSAGRVGESIFRDPPRLAVAVLAGIIFVFLMSFFQVDEGGIPRGLTRKAALFPVVFVGVIGIGTSPLIIASSGSVAYAAAGVFINCITTLAMSFALRHFRVHA